MDTSSDVTIQVLVFSLVAAAFTTVYITQPVLPVIQDEFAVDARTASLSVSMVIFGIALANLPFGILADRYPIKPLLLTGGTVITATSLSVLRRRASRSLLRRALHTGTFHPVTDHVPCRLFGEEFTRITSQRGDGFLCISDRSGRDGRPVAGLGSIRLCTGATLRQRVRIVDHGDHRRLTLASRTERGAQA